MRRHPLASLLAALGCAAGAVAFGGCGLDVFADCSVTKTCAGGGQASTQAVCTLDGDPSEPSPCGLYVASFGKDDNPGTAERPLRTLSKAIEKVHAEGGRPIYACAETFLEPLTLHGGEVIHGGYNCATGTRWSAQAGVTTISASANEVPLRVRSGGPTVLSNLKVIAADATLPGTSSIAVIAEGADLRLVRSHLEAGRGANGKTPPSEPVGASTGAAGKMGSPACTYSTPQEVVTMCGVVESIGGSGGFGTSPWGKAGRNSSHGKDVSGGYGGEPEEFTLTECTAGGPGDEGSVGAPGNHGTLLGTISANGYEGAAGTNGSEGSVGLAGGGGGAALGGAGVSKCPTGGSLHGAGGGTGGTGGCGGKGGAGGGPGGASFGLMSLDARVTFEEVTIVTAGGGKGGDGASGQAGGKGGIGGPGGAPPLISPLKPGCDGGKGGKGGDGGNGGGGRGGHSIGIAYVGNAPAVTKGVSFELGLEGPGGQGGDPQDAAPAGVRAEAQSFD